VPGFGDEFYTEVACELVHGKGNCLEATDGRWYPKGLLKPIIAPANGPTVDLNPVALAESALSDLTSPVDVVVKWVLKQLTKLGSLIENDISKVYGYIGSRLGGVENTISHLAGEVNSLLGSLGSDVGKALATLRHDIAADVDTAVAGVRSELSTVEREAKTLGHDAEHYADTALRTFERDVLDPALRDLRVGLTDARRAAEAALSAFERDVVRPIEHDAAEGLAEAKKAIYFIDHSGLDAVHLVDKCYDWLRAFADHPIKSLEAVPADVLKQMSTSWSEKQVTAEAKGFSSFAAELEKEL
jgi:hypothetical protein